MISFERDLSRPDAIPVQTVRARWGSRPSGDYRGYEPDWHVITIRHTEHDKDYPFCVEGWLPATSNRWDGPVHGPAGKPFIWRVSSLSDPRFDLTEAVYLRPIQYGAGE